VWDAQRTPMRPDFWFWLVMGALIALWLALWDDDHR
jgi:hypothetical protein